LDLCKNKQITDERCSGVAREYCGSPSYDVTWLVNTNNFWTVKLKNIKANSVDNGDATAEAHPEFFLGRGGADTEGIYNLCLILKIVL
jgi:hypothetical protein